MSRGFAAATASLVVLAGCGGGGDHIVLQQIGRFDEPIHVAQPPGDTGSLYVVEKRGVVRVTTGGAKQRAPFLDISKRVFKNDDERGMFSIAFAPDYQSSGRFYVSYTSRPHGDLVVDEYRRSATDPVAADVSTRRPLLDIPQNSEDHHGGFLLFGDDGHLYIGSGDGGPSGDPHNVGQNRKTLLGKILRIDPVVNGKPVKGRKRHYAVPPDNPFVGKRGRDEIFAYGFRNPWRFSFDPMTGEMWIGDVGQDRFEEVDSVPLAKARGGNFGWNAYEGFAGYRGGVAKKRTILPVLTYPHSKGCSIIAGPVVADSGLEPAAGSFLFGDFCSGRLYAVRPQPGSDEAKEHQLKAKPINELSSFGTDNSGQVYATSQAGPLYRLVGE